MKKILPSFFNTLTRSLEPFNPIEAGKVKLYTCGPTVYNFAHIGNLRTYIFEDILRRTLEAMDYRVQHVMNITDVGHLESDADDGDDKMAKAAKREQRSPWDIARSYEEAFFADCKALHVEYPTVVCRATEHIQEMQAMIQTLEQKGLTYTVDGNVYFRINKFPTYSQLSRRELDELLEGARVDVDHRKEDPRDFVLWFSQSKFPNQIMKWDSPWGTGFPGWHIECSAMATKYLGEHIDIHTGGVDHISVHHSNEIAQSEGCLGHKWVNTWMHGEFVVIDSGKMAKSAGSFLTLKSLTDLNYDPMHYRYLCFGAHYRSQLLFGLEALSGARTAYESLKNRAIAWHLTQTGKPQLSPAALEYHEAFWGAMANDLNSPLALSIVWDMAKTGEISAGEKWLLIQDFDQVMGLGVSEFKRPQLSTELMELVEKREQARQEKRWADSDAMRQQLLEQGIQIKDTPTGPDWYMV